MAKTDRFEMRVSPDFLEMIDEWRSAQRPIPSRTEAVQQLCRKTIKTAPKKIDPKLSGPEIK